MSISGGDILLKGEVKARLRYRSDSSFYEFLKDEKTAFQCLLKSVGVTAGMKMK